MRLLAYSHDTVGLGHLRRTLGICDELVRRMPGATALIVTGSPMAEGFHLPPRTDYVKLPSVRKLDNAAYAARSLDLDFARLSRMRSAMLHDTALSFDPDVLLVDKTPRGLGGELEATLRGLEQRGGHARVILGLRDILDEPARMRQEWHRDGSWQALERHFDAVWIYGSPDIYDTIREYAFPPAIAARSVYVGYLPKYNGLVPPAEIARQLGLAGRRLVVVTAGGGEDGFPIFDHYLGDLEAGLGPDATLHCLIAGPGMPVAKRDALQTRARRSDVHFAAFSDRMTSLIAAADLVVGMGGYNTTMETLSLGRRAVIVPRVEPRTEQLIRAERLAARGLARLVHPRTLGRGVLMEAVRAELEGHGGGPRLPLRFDGHDGVRRELARLLGNGAPAARARTRGGAS